MREPVASAAMHEEWRTTEQIHAARERIEATLDGYRRPAAYALGVSTVGPSGAALDTRYPVVNVDEHLLPAAVLASATGYRSGTATVRIDAAQLDAAIEQLAPAEACPDFDHPNLRAWRALRA